MKKLFALAIILLLFCVGWTFGQEASGTSLNGSFWHEVTQNMAGGHIMYVKGFLQGYLERDADVLVTMVDEKMVKETAANKQMRPETKEIMIRAVNSQLERMKEIQAELSGSGKNQNLTIHDIIDGVEAFYSDFRNQPVCWGDAVKFSVMSGNGNAPNDEELDSARKAGAESGCN